MIKFEEKKPSFNISEQFSPAYIKNRNLEIHVDSKRCIQSFILYLTEQFLIVNY